MTNSKIISKLLALVMAISMFAAPVNVSAAETDIIDDFVSNVLSLDNKQQFVNLVELFNNVENKDGLSEVYTDMFSQLTDSQVEKVRAYGVVIESVREFVKYTYTDALENEYNDIAKLEDYLGLDGSEDPTALETAIRVREDELKIKLEEIGVTNELLSLGFTKMDKLFGLIDLGNSQLAQFMGVNLKFFNTTGEYEELSLNETKAKDFIQAANDDGLVSVSDVDAAVGQLNGIVTYYNGKSSSNDKTAIFDYLNNNGFINVTSSDTSSGGGGSYTPPTTDETDEATTDLDNLASDDTDVSDDEAVETTEAAFESLNEGVTTATDSDSATEAVTKVTTALESATKIVAKLDSQASQVNVVKSVEKALNSTIDALDLIDDADEVEAQAKAIIANVAALKDGVGTGAGITKKVEKAAAKIAEKAVEKAGKVKVTSVVEGTKVKADLSNHDFTDQINKVMAKQITMNNELKANKLDTIKKIEKKVTVEVPVADDSKEVEVDLPSLEEVFTKVDKVKVESKIASFELQKGTFGNEEASALKLSASNVDVNELDEDLKAKVPAGVTTIVDLNAFVSGEQVTKFKKPIDVAIPYTLKEGEVAEKVSVYLLTDAGEVVKVAGKYNPVTGKVMVKRNHFSKYFINQSTDTFGDIANVAWAKNEIEVLAGKGIISGKGNDKFDPSNNITRAEFVALIARMLQVDGDVSDLSFEDVDTNAWYAEDLAAAYSEGLIAGKSATEFAPNANISRQEAAIVITNVLEYLGYIAEESTEVIDSVFTDKSNVASWASSSVATVYREEIMVGKGEKFDPNGLASRAEAARMIYSLYFGY